jgi:putative ABC transport system permease protein
MRPMDVLVMALQAIARNKLRSFLTTLGIIIGVGSVIAMVHLGQSAARSVTEEIAAMGSNLLFVIPGTGQRGPGAIRMPGPPFDMSDVHAVERDVPGIVVAPSAVHTTTVVYGYVNQAMSVEGTTNEYFTVRNHPVAEGREFEAGELSRGAAVCIIGRTIAREFNIADPLGASLRIGRTSCLVVGVLAEKGLSMGQDRDRVILMPIRAVQRRLAGSPDVRSMYVSALVDGTTTRVRHDIEALLRERRRIGRGIEDDFYVRDTQDIAAALEQTGATLTLLLGGIAAVSLVVGGIGIMNIMLVSVTERTREIGIRLAIGARTGDVLTQFLVEAIVLAILGGVIGLVLGLGGTFLATHRFGMPFMLSGWVMALGFFFSVAIGIVFGYFPARKAAHLNPIDALRHE